MSKIDDIISTLKSVDQYESYVGTKLEYLKTTKKEIAEAIEECEVNVPNNASFFSFGALIRQIAGRFRSGSTNKMTYSPSKNATATYNNASSAPSNVGSGSYDIDSGEEKKAGQWDVTSNGHWTPADDKDKPDGWAQVYVRVGAAAFDHDSKFTVNFWADEQMSRSLYTATDVPIFGVASYKGEIPSQSGKIFVGWKDVPIPGAGTNGSVREVCRNMDVCPDFIDAPTGDTNISDDWDVICQDGGAHYPIGATKTLTIGEFTVPDQQAFYFADQTAYTGRRITKVPLSKGVKYPGGTFSMVKVGMGEDGTSSTWICNPSGSSFLSPFTPSDTTNGDSVLNTRSAGLTWNDFVCANYGDYGDGAPNLHDILAAGNKVRYSYNWCGSYLREVLNTAFLSAFPKALQSSIQPVKKYTSGLAKVYDNPGPDNPGTAILTDYESIDSIWLPSIREVGVSRVTGLSSGDKSKYRESVGIEYSGVTWSYAASALRSTERPIVVNVGKNRNTGADFMSIVSFGFCLSPHTEIDYSQIGNDNNSQEGTDNGNNSEDAGTT